MNALEQTKRHLKDKDKIGATLLPGRLLELIEQWERAVDPADLVQGDIVKDADGDVFAFYVKDDERPAQCLIGGGGAAAGCRYACKDMTHPIRRVRIEVVE